MINKIPPVIFWFLILLNVLMTYSHASTNDPDELIKEVISAYGGKTLTQAHSLKIIDHNKGPWPGESENPGLPEIWRINEELTIDFKQKRKSLLSYRVPRTTLDLEKWIFDGEAGFSYDIFHEKYAREDWVSFNILGGSIVRSSDTMHAKHLHSELKEATYVGDEYFRGKVHHKLTATFNFGETFTYYIDKQSSLISKARWHHPAADLIYVFSNHQVSDGLHYSSDMNFFVNGKLRLTSVLRGLELSPNLAEAFRKFDSFKPWGETYDNRDFTVRKIAKGVYQSGQGRSMTVFIEQKERFIAIGGADALKDNFAQMKEFSNSNKPLGYFLVTHHHRGNLNGLKNPLELGAKLVIAKAHQETVAESLSQPLSDQQLVIIQNRTPFMLGDLTIFDIPTAHSQHYLLAHLPKQKIVIAEEHYETNLKTAKPRIYKDMKIFGNVLSDLNLEIDYLIDIRSWRTIKMAEFTQWIADFKEKSCPAGYAICAKG